MVANLVTQLQLWMLYLVYINDNQRSNTGSNTVETKWKQMTFISKFERTNCFGKKTNKKRDDS